MTTMRDDVFLLTRDPDAEATEARGDAAQARCEPSPLGDPASPQLDPRLMIWLSPAFPVGAFAYSHGLELAAGRGWVGDRAALEDWLSALVTAGSLRTDLILLAEAWRAAGMSDLARLAKVNDVALALQPSAERHLETVMQGSAFVAAMSTAWPAPKQSAAISALGEDISYPVAVGLFTAGHAIPLKPAALGYGIAFVGNLVSAAIRLSLIGQTDAQRITAGLLPHLDAAARVAVHLTLDDLGSATLRSDLASLAHETQYSRLFRS